MSYTRSQFVTDVLRGIGNSNPSAQVVGWMVAWSVAETGHPSGAYQGAAFNLLNTTQPATGTTDFNSIGVKNYASYAQGITATVQTVQNVYYPALLEALLTNNATALGYGQNSPSPGVLANLNTWCGSCGYGNAFVANSGAFASEVFAGTATTVPPGPLPPPSSTSIPTTTSSVTGVTTIAKKNQPDHCSNSRHERPTGGSRRRDDD